jgi:uncharacterized membrane protein YdbT with pleckstrin-like domain
MFHLDRLPNAVPDEKLVYFLRRHPITLWSIVLSLLVLVSFPPLGYWYVSQYQPGLLENSTTLTFIILIGSVFFLFAWLFLFQNFIDYYLDMWIVTNRRILNIEQIGMFSRRVSELRLYRIQDVTATVSGIIHTMFDYGEVEIQTAGEKEHFLFEDITHPNAIAKTILELAEIDRREHLDEAVEEFGVAEHEKKAA